MRWRSGSIHVSKNDTPGVRPDESADQIEQRRFPGAVRADHGSNRILLGGEGDAIHSTDSAERDAKIMNLKHRCHRPPPPNIRSIGGRISPIRPFGRKITTAM